MFAIPSNVRVFLYTKTADMRKSFTGLAFLAREVIQQNPLSGNLFVFRNRRNNCLKVLYWDRDGFSIWYKRLEKGTFQFPVIKNDTVSLEISPEKFSFILQGIDLKCIRHRPRYQLPNHLEFYTSR